MIDSSNFRKDALPSIISRNIFKEFLHSFNSQEKLHFCHSLIALQTKLTEQEQIIPQRTEEYYQYFIISPKILFLPKSHKI